MNKVMNVVRRSVAGRMRLWVGLSCLLVLGACVTVVNANVKRTTSLGAVKSLAVERFSVSPHINLDGSEPAGKPTGSPFTLSAPANDWVQETQNGNLVGALANNGYFQVQDAATADGVIRGNLEYVVSDSGSYADIRNQQTGTTLRTYTLTRTISVALTFQVAGKDGGVLASSTVTAEDKDSWEAGDEVEARSRARGYNLQEKLRTVIGAANTQLLQQIAPHEVSETYMLERGDSELIKEGNREAEKGNWAGAAQLWKSSLDSGSLNDRYAATYNLAIYDEIEDRLEDAMKKYEEVYAKTGMAQITNDLDRIRPRVMELRRRQELEEQRKAMSAPKNEPPASKPEEPGT